MSYIFDSPSWIWSSILVVIPSILFSLFALWLVRKTFAVETLKKNHDVAGFTFSIVGVLYSVILGFTVINVQTRHTEAEGTIRAEATILSDLYRDAGFFPKEGREQIRAVLREYTHYILNKEWNVPSEKRFHNNTQTILEKLWVSYYGIDLQDEKTRIWYEQSISKLDSLMNARLAREFSYREHLGSMMWSLLIFGAVITICFMFFFGLENVRTQMLMTGLLAGYLSFILYLVFSLDHVFKGPSAVKPYALEQVAESFDTWDL